MRPGLLVPLSLAVFGSVLGLGLTRGDAQSIPEQPANAAAPAAPVAGLDICVPDYKALADKLSATYAEEPVSAGLGQDGNLFSVFAAADTGTWTLVMTLPEGTSCVVAVGTAWQTRPGIGKVGA